MNPVKSLKHIGDKIRYLRIEKEYSQEYMAETLGVSQASYSRIEKEAEETPLKLLQGISEILEIRLEQLLSSSASNIYFNNNNDNACQAYGNIQIYNFPKEALTNVLQRLDKLEKDVRE